MVCLPGGRFGDRRRHPRRVLHPGGGPREPSGEGARLPHQLGAGGSVLVAAQRRPGPDDPPALHHRFPLVPAGGGAVQLHLRLPEAGDGVERADGGRLRRAGGAFGCGYSDVSG